MVRRGSFQLCQARSNPVDAGQGGQRAQLSTDCLRFYQRGVGFFTITGRDHRFGQGDKREREFVGGGTGVSNR